MRWAHIRLAVAAALLAGCAGASSGGGGQPLRVMSYNIQYGNEGIDSVIAVIRAERPDIVGLQEVDVHWGARSQFIDQAQAVATGLGMNFKFARIYQYPATEAGGPPREFGVALLSRYPITSFVNHPITRLSTQEPNAAPAPLPGLLEVTVDVAGQPVRVFNVHLDYRRDPAIRQQQVREMLGYIGESQVPTILVGDMNAPPDAPELAPLFRNLNDTWPASHGAGFTSPAVNPSAKIDYVMTAGPIRVKDSHVPVVRASDHLPVVVDLEIAREKP